MAKFREYAARQYRMYSMTGVLGWCRRLGLSAMCTYSILSPDSVDTDLLPLVVQAVSVSVTTQRHQDVCGEWQGWAGRWVMLRGSEQGSVDQAPSKQRVPSRPESRDQLGPKRLDSSPLMTAVSWRVAETPVMPSFPCFFSRIAPGRTMCSVSSMSERTSKKENTTFCNTASE